MSTLPPTRSSPVLPALSEHRLLRYVAFTVLYAAQGIPQGLFVVALPAYMAQRGLSTAEVGSFIGIALLPWSLKLVAGPIMDRFSFLPMGRRRPWVLGAQIGAAASFAAFALIPDPLAHVAYLAAAACVVNTFLAFQDVAVDGMAIDVVPLEEQTRLNGFMWGGATLGVAGAAVGSARLLDAYGVGVAALALAAAVGCIMLIPLFVRERTGERLLPWTVGRASATAERLHLRGWRTIWRTLLRAVLVPASLATAAAIFLFGAFDGLVIAMMPVLTVQELGWTDTGYADLVAMAQVLAGVLGMVLGGVLMDRFGRVRVMVGMVSFIIVAAVTMGLLPALWPARMTITAFAVGYIVTFTLLTIAYLATAMALCSKRVAATQFALYMGISNLGRAAGSASLGPLDAHLGYTALFFAVAVCGAVALLIVRSVDLDRHHARFGGMEAASDRPAPLETEEPVAVAG